MSAQLKQRPDAAAVLCKAMFNASEQLTLNQQELGRVVGINRTGVSRLKQSGLLDPASKRGELALLLIRAARALFALSGGNHDWIKHFMRSNNKLTGGIPAEQMQSVQGLMRVVTYLDAIRGKV
ncbi:MbcA/ParS/Xre antitoxin family protein [Amphritea japonica]|uniref:XRE family transcriptional regulator n=1 Tax=Amphritea japonica ATCC BAA-1530 TaxID=1278309 RepID=A0A7R6P5F1_9GAMM|nr:MbcA/ParS/Xre antitoxin family protein [Amphritea japonica]BBB27559.1 XRE family transcriptional regulator [Amphritea japonica ATCC BAA-1530]